MVSVQTRNTCTVEKGENNINKHFQRKRLIFEGEAENVSQGFFIILSTVLLIACHYNYNDCAFFHR